MTEFLHKVRGRAFLHPIPGAGWRVPQHAP